MDWDLLFYQLLIFGFLRTLQDARRVGFVASVRIEDLGGMYADLGSIDTSTILLIPSVFFK